DSQCLLKDDNAGVTRLFDDYGPGNRQNRQGGPRTDVRHPDKNTAPDAQEKFVAISRAYELLSDPLRKEHFDKFGAVDESPQTGPQNHGF
ncbi:unnamed protein product, partial [Heligmosomoides polygyrus]|uniref:J domain-containing protein n=1 Tax=Heligmosomoides polygyrus TaxID=6339 RepID=A0A183GKR1_HELPZ